MFSLCSFSRSSAPRNSSDIPISLCEAALRWIGLCQGLEDPDFESIKHFLELPAEDDDHYAIMEHVELYFDKIHEELESPVAEHVKINLMKGA